MTRQENQLLFDRFIQCAFITDDWQQAAWAHDLSTAPQRLGEGFRIFAWIILQAGIGLGQARKQLQQALLAAAWTNFLRCQTAEDQSSDAIVVFQCRPGKQARRLCRQHGLEQQLAAEKQPRALFNQNEYRAFALFVEQLGVRLLAACGHTPVDTAYIIARLV